ncbi:putative Metallophosphoesterase [Cupriavidus phytorum]|uniref:Metallophosphoesterase n=2 Tax=Cupriavidus TaxID=106589 RepID=A0A375BC10_9BURK|nr:MULTISPECIES: metallophosphoesterase [Cupriavidus]PZX30650.1 calcineurin-like phosphoesterase family protein [Cupriavidus alkaliphilus]SOY41217.1 putative Metallophosphoesterase [Cupriavidus taiwanensis]
MKLRILSDLHIEHNLPQSVPACDADLVILAGDIANGRDGIDWAVGTFSQPVVYVPGNHEYYESNFDTVDQQMAEAAAAHPQVRLLNGEVAEFDGARIIGTTWWTDYTLFGTDRRDEAMQACAKAMYDHRLIEIRGDDGHMRQFTPQDALARHLAASDWLQAQLALPYAGKTVVVTHHGPDLGSLDPRFSHDLVSGGFLSRRPDLVAQADLWIHGHTHTSFDYCVDNSRVVCNPRGYVSRRTGELENKSFDWCCVVEV